MDKLLLSSLLIVATVLTSMPAHSAPMQTSKSLISSIDPLQKRYNNYLVNDNVDDLVASASTTVVVDEEPAKEEDEPNSASSPAAPQPLKKDDNSATIVDNSSSDSSNKLTKSTRSRQNKMIGFYPAAAAAAAVSPFHPFGYFYNQPPPPAVYYPPEFYDDFATFFDGYGGEDDEIMSRTNPGGRRRPIYKNSPIYYIRLPPQPYMFIPGLGYVSQPPTYHPMTLPPPPPPQPQPSPFFNLPLDFISNGKPTNIYQWGSPPGISYMQQPQAPAIQPPQNVYSGYPAQPQYTQQRPQRPYRPQRPMNPYGYDHQGGDSKITSLKGPQPYIFNGQPTGEIFLLTSPTSYSSYSAFSDPRYGGNSYY